MPHPGQRRRRSPRPHARRSPPARDRGAAAVVGRHADAAPRPTPRTPPISPGARRSSPPARAASEIGERRRPSAGTLMPPPGRRRARRDRRRRAAIGGAGLAGDRGRRRSNAGTPMPNPGGRAARRRCPPRSGAAGRDRPGCPRRRPANPAPLPGIGLSLLVGEQGSCRCIGACSPASAARWRAVAGQTCWPPPMTAGIGGGWARSAGLPSSTAGQRRRPPDIGGAFPPGSRGIGGGGSCRPARRWRFPADALRRRHRRRLAAIGGAAMAGGRATPPPAADGRCSSMLVRCSS